MDTSNYMENRLREAITKEVENYIGYVYGDDTHMNDKLIIKSLMSPFHMVEYSTMIIKMDMIIFRCLT